MFLTRRRRETLPGPPSPALRTLAPARRTAAPVGKPRRRPESTGWSRDEPHAPRRGGPAPRGATVSVRRRRGLALALGLATVLGAPRARDAGAAPPPSKVESLTLDNGLRVVLRRTPGAADGAVAVVYEVGGLHDPAGRAGLAHVIEQVYLLAGTEVMPARERDDVRMRGPARGAWHGLGFDHATSEDHTLFVRVLPCKDLESEVEDAADRMTGLRVREEEVAAARAHVRNELQNVEGGIPAVAALDAARTALLEPASRGRRLGRTDEVATISLADVKDRLERVYRPRNATLAIMGDFDLGLTRALVKKRFGAIPAGEPVGPPVDRPETPLPPEHAGAKGPVTLRRRTRDDARGGFATLAVSAPKVEASKEYAAFLVLAARLYDGQFATPKGAAPVDPAVFAFDPWRDPTAAYLSRAVPPDGSVDEAAEKLVAFLAATQEPVTAADVGKARTRMNAWFGVTPPEGSIADQPLVVAYGDARRAALHVDGDAIVKRLGSVKTEDLRAAAARPQVTVAVVPGPSSRR